MRAAVKRVLRAEAPLRVGNGRTAAVDGSDPGFARSPGAATDAPRPPAYAPAVSERRAESDATAVSAGGSAVPAGRSAVPPETEGDRRVDPASFREALGHFATGVTVVTTMDGERPWGTTVNGFNSASLRPPLVLVAFDRSRRIVPALLASRRFAVNILGEDQQALSDCFSGAPVQPDREGFCGATWHPGSTGLPILDAAVASLECSLVDVHPAGDHDLYIARVDAVSHAAGHPLPLLYYRGRYLRIERATALDLEGKPER